MAKKVTFLSTSPKYRIKLKSTFVEHLKTGGVRIEPGKTIEFTPRHPGGEFTTSDEEIIKALRENKYYGKKGHFWEYKPTPVKDLIKQKQEELERLKKEAEKEKLEEEEEEDVLDVEEEEEEAEPGKTFKYKCKKCSFKTNNLAKYRKHIAEHNFLRKE